ncbi:MAG: hypothetical protein M1839_009297 [Geoglossum umbratile]|nr:MAG: hypothetical protein M1839_009297 [Geoglossum umbratile]
MAQLLVISYLTLLTFASAGPVEPRQQSLALPKSYVAFGDSYSAGIGSGKFLTISADGADNACARMDGSYPWEIFKFNLFEPVLTEFRDFYSCSGAVMDDIGTQVQKLQGKKADLITLSISGNDFFFGEIVTECVYPYKITGISDFQKICSDALTKSQNAVKDPANWNKYLSKVLLAKSALNPGGTLIITGYAKFFPTPQTNDKCESTYFMPVTAFQALTMKKDNRLRMNSLVDDVNSHIQTEVVAKAGDGVHFIDIDKAFEGHRFCEPKNGNDPIGSNNADVWFNDLETTLDETGPYNPASTNLEMQAWNKWSSGLPAGFKDPPGFTGRGITDKLQQNSSFHPKSPGQKSITVQILNYLIMNSVKSGKVTVGPAQYCMTTNHGAPQKCFQIPAGCGVKNAIDNTPPTIFCADGTTPTPTLS